jgi:hypothetical protein
MLFTTIGHPLYEKAVLKMSDIHGDARFTAKTKRTYPVLVRPLN